MTRVLFAAPQGATVSVEHDQVPAYLGGGFQLQTGGGADAVIRVFRDGNFETALLVPVDTYARYVEAGWSFIGSIDHSYVPPAGSLYAGTTEADYLAAMRAAGWTAAYFVVGDVLVRVPIEVAWYHVKRGYQLPSLYRPVGAPDVYLGAHRLYGYQPAPLTSTYPKQVNT